MNNIEPRRLATLTAAAVLAVAATTDRAPAQVPPGWCAVARTVSATNGPAGVTLVDVRAPGSPAVDVGNLPLTLTGAGSFGCASVAIDADGGRLVVGEAATVYADARVHVLTLTGTNVTAGYVYPVAGGTNPNLTTVVDLDWFGDDLAILCSASLAPTGPLAGHVLGVFRPDLGPPGTPGVITPVPLGGLGFGLPVALAVDEAQGVAYVGYDNSVSGGAIYRVPFPGDGTIHNVGQQWAWAPLLTSLDVGADGVVYATSDGDTLAFQDVNGQGVPTTVGVGAYDTALLAGDGSLLRIGYGTGLLTIAAPGATPVPLATLAGSPRRVAYRPTLDAYTEAVPAAPTLYRWQLAPNPGGFPSLGNAAFSLTVEQSPASLVGLAIYSLGEAVTPVPPLGVTLLVDPATAAPGPTLPAGATASMALPIPTNGALLGQSVTAQTLHWEGPTWGASPGLRIRLVP